MMPTTIAGVDLQTFAALCSHLKPMARENPRQVEISGITITYRRRGMEHIELAGADWQLNFCWYMTSGRRPYNASELPLVQFKDTEGYVQVIEISHQPGWVRDMIYLKLAGIVAD